MRKIIILLAVLALAGCGISPIKLTLSAPTNKQTFNVGRVKITECLYNKIYYGYYKIYRMRVGVQSLNNETTIGAGRFGAHFVFSLVDHGEKTEVVLRAMDAKTAKRAWNTLLECVG